MGCSSAGVAEQDFRISLMDNIVGERKELGVSWIVDEADEIAVVDRGNHPCDSGKEAAKMRLSCFGMLD